ncbi:sodium:proton antiporter [Fodinisporobacter ferrooxydans]|uniref:Nickel/cobalt efflux system n=1 Tax=Fodinisporobacter ferrooxydans TaxID=2901836 RepID=A0ABY4CH29_9BACL|nr:sodium:proton antiporter [Alicyclobacillaceae bacterium MYW30-H2]
MEYLSLFLFVCLLGVRNGLAADHLAFIDGQTRYNCRIGSPIARWVGTLFSLGHGIVLASMAVFTALFMQNFTFPSYFDSIATWVSILSLFAIGTLNMYPLIRAKATHETFQLRGMKGKFLPRIVRETSNPLLIILIGALFALASDTVSQTSIWIIPAAHAGTWTCALLSLVFILASMMISTIDSWITYRVITGSHKLGQTISIVIGWVIVILAYGLSIYQLVLLLNPEIQLDFNDIGAVIFLFMLCFLGFVVLRSRQNTDA